MSHQTEHDGHEAPAELAEQLAEKAASERDPGVAAYLLEWANLFRRLADLGADNRRYEDRADGEQPPH